ncbi:MAG: RagB/SusD family nutrient uptake outer membrane protein [Bacteroidetes bacterium]|nr:RagB/SusD family nutrient uptake outer membrane protein [Bacteroidota bacterium]
MKKSLFIFAFFTFVLGCTSLDEELEGTITPEEAASSGDVEGLLSAAYSSLNRFGTQDNVWALAQHTSDELAGPTRGPDWDDGGAWRQLHLHTWNTTSGFINNSWGGLLEGVFRAGIILQFNPTPQQEAEARFLRAFYSFWVLDNWGLVLSREPNEDLSLPPSVNLSRQDGIDWIIAELEAALVNLPDTNNNGRATKNTARAMLMKAHLNRAVYKATNANGGAQKGPFSHEIADMNAVISYGNDVINSGQFELDENYFDNFRPENSSLSSENIFVINNVRGANSSSNQSRWFMTLHYNQTPGGWNGFVGLSDLYDSFEDGDIRKGFEGEILPELKGKTGVDVGILIGQQYKKDSLVSRTVGDSTVIDTFKTKIKERPGADLIFTKNFSLTTSNESSGLRIIKYPMDFDNIDSPENDYVLLRYADVLLMKAEAILRGGSDPMGESALQIVNDLRAVRGASPLAAVDLSTNRSQFKDPDGPSILQERSRELYWEGWRRNDQIRFGTYLDAYQEKPNQSTETFLLFPIPPDALSTNPELTQRPGY